MKIPGIKEFPTDEKIWRIDWLGEVDLNPSVLSEPSIEVIISPLIEENADPFSNKSVVHAERRVLRIGVGQFPLMEIGSLWKKGFPFILGTKKTEKLDDLLIDETTVRIVRTDYRENGEWLIPPNFHKVGKNGFSAQCVCIEHEGDPFGIIIPVAEIIRFYYAVSTDMAQAIFSGTFRYNLDSIVGENSRYDAANKLYFLELNKYFSDEDGWVIARILNSPEANHGAMLIHDSLLKASAMGSPMSPETIFPFSGKTTLMFRRKKIQSFGKKWRRLVYSLVRCTANFSFEQLMIDRENCSKQANPETDLPEEEKKIAYLGKKRALSPESDEQKIQNENEPDAGIERIRIPLPSERFAAISGKKVLKPEKDYCLYKSGKVPGFKKVDIKALGTGQGGYANTEIAPLSLDAKRGRDKTLQASFENFIEMIEWLDTYPGVKAFIRDYDERMEFLPLLKPPKNSQWAYLDSSQKIRRRAIIADVVRNGRYFSLIELQRREGDSFSICLLSVQDGSKIPNPQIYEILRSVTEKNGRWENIKKYPPGIRKSTMKHTRASIHEFAEKVSFRLEQLSAS